MSHYASGQWKVGSLGEWGPVARFDTVGTMAAISQTTLYTTPLAGIFRIDGVMSCITVGTGAGQTWDLDLEVTNGATQTTANFIGAMDALTQGSVKTGTATFYLPAGATVKYTVNSNGTVTTAPIAATTLVVTVI